jgi:hypothetical protein
MARTTLSLLLIALFAALFAAARGSAVPAAENVQRRDENLPARVPYVFPAPGTDAVRLCLDSETATGIQNYACIDRGCHPGETGEWHVAGSGWRAVIILCPVYCPEPTTNMHLA